MAPCRRAPNPAPHAIFTPKHVPLPLRLKVVEELDRMEKAGVTNPIPWCTGMAVVRKMSGIVRICVDLKPLNQSMLREVHPLPTVHSPDKRSKNFLNVGCQQWVLASLRVHASSQHLSHHWDITTNSHFGISSAPEHFQQRMSEILSGLDGVLCQMDNTLIFGKDQVEHDERLEAALIRIDQH